MKNFLTLALILTLCGCSSMMHELQPHRLWRWNYHEPPGRTDDALFSIDDPLIQQDGESATSPTRPMHPDHE